MFYKKLILKFKINTCNTTTSHKHKMTTLIFQLGGKSISPNGCLDKDLLESIPYMKARLGQGFRDSIKEGQTNKIVIPVGTCDDLVTYFKTKVTGKVGKMTGGVFQIADFFGDLEFITKYGFLTCDYDALSAIRDDCLSDLATRYLEFAFSNSAVMANEHMVHLIDRVDTYNKIIFTNGRSVTPKDLKWFHASYLAEIQVYLKKFFVAFSLAYQRWDLTNDQRFTPEQLKMISIPLESDLVSDFVADYFGRLRGLWEYCKENPVYNKMGNWGIQMTLHIVEFKHHKKTYWDVLKTLGILDQDKMSLFANSNPGLARFVWEDKDMRSTLIKGYLCVPVRRQRFYREASFDQAFPLNQGHI